MITRVEVRNIKCLREVDVDLGPLTAFVGANAAGKSTLLRCLNPRFVPTVRDIWRHEQLPASIALEGDDGFKYTQRVGQQAVGKGRAPQVQMLQLEVARLRSPNQVQVGEHLQQDGGNLANVFATVSRKKQVAIVEQLALLGVPAFGDVELHDLQPTASPGSHELRFYDRWDPRVSYGPSEVSDGTMLMLAFLTLQFQQSVIDVVTVEEPERGLHPYLIHELVSFLRKLAHGELGDRAIQVVLATHSAVLLDALKPEEVRFLTRVPEDGSVRVSAPQTTSPEWEEAYREYHESLGSLWLTGGLGGVPPR